MIANPPCGKDWKRDQDTVRDECDRGGVDRFVRVADQPSAVPTPSAPKALSMATCRAASRSGSKAKEPS